MLLSVCDYTRRDIASAIKEVLDAVNEVSKKHQGDPRMREHKKVSVTVLSNKPLELCYFELCVSLSIRYRYWTHTRRCL